MGTNQELDFTAYLAGSTDWVADRPYSPERHGIDFDDLQGQQEYRDGYTWFLPRCHWYLRGWKLVDNLTIPGVDMATCLRNSGVSL